jgi:hypothetical protein
LEADQGQLHFFVEEEAVWVDEKGTEEEVVGGGGRLPLPTRPWGKGARAKKKKESDPMAAPARVSFAAAHTACTRVFQPPAAVTHLRSQSSRRWKREAIATTKKRRAVDGGKKGAPLFLCLRCVRAFREHARAVSKKKGKPAQRRGAKQKKKVETQHQNENKLDEGAPSARAAQGVASARSVPHTHAHHTSKYARHPL